MLTKWLNRVPNYLALLLDLTYSIHVFCMDLPVDPCSSLESGSGVEIHLLDAENRVIRLSCTPLYSWTVLSVSCIAIHKNDYANAKGGVCIDMSWDESICLGYEFDEPSQTFEILPGQQFDIYLMSLLLFSQQGIKFSHPAFPSHNQGYVE